MFQYQRHNYRIGTVMGYKSYSTLWKNRVKLVQGAIMAETVLLPDITVLITQYSEPEKPELMSLGSFASLRFGFKLGYNERKTKFHARKTMRLVRAILPTTPADLQLRIVRTLCLIVDLRLAEPAYIFRDMLGHVWESMIPADRVMVTACWSLDIMKVATKEVLHTRLTQGSWLFSQIRDPPRRCNQPGAAFKAWVRSPFVHHEDGQLDAGWPSSVTIENGFSFSIQATPPACNQEGRPWEPPTLRRSARLGYSLIDGRDRCTSGW